jgi:hypothetical protein
MAPECGEVTAAFATGTAGVGFAIDVFTRYPTARPTPRQMAAIA